jgi:hypothetical protein
VIWAILALIALAGCWCCMSLAHREAERAQAALAEIRTMRRYYEPRPENRRPPRIDAETGLLIDEYRENR